MIRKESACLSLPVRMYIQGFIDAKRESGELLSDVLYNDLDLEYRQALTEQAVLALWIANHAVK